MKYRSFFIATAVFFMAAIGLLAQPVIQISAITEQSGTYAVGNEVTFEFTFTNAAKFEALQTVPQGGDAAVEAENTAITLRNRAKKAISIAFIGNLVGADIYGILVD